MIEYGEIIMEMPIIVPAERKFNSLYASSLLEFSSLYIHSIKVNEAAISGVSILNAVSNIKIAPGNDEVRVMMRLCCDVVTMAMALAYSTAKVTIVVRIGVTLVRRFIINELSAGSVKLPLNNRSISGI